MIAVVILLGIILLYVGLKQILLKREIKRMSDELEEMATANSNALMTVELPDKAVISLAGAINNLQEHHHKNVSEYIRQSEELKQSMADISHDLRTPLTSLVGYLNLLKKENVPEKQAEYLAIAYEKAETLNYLVASLFELARLEANTYSFDWKSINIKEVLAGELASFYPQFMEKGQEPEICMDDEPLWLVSDDMALKRIFNNLLQNALNHGDGDIRVEVGQSDNHAIVKVSNAAARLQLKDGQQLFQRTYTADPSRSKKGAGLGLAIVKAFAERMNGTVTAWVAKGRLTIEVKLPLQYIKHLED